MPRNTESLLHEIRQRIDYETLFAEYLRGLRGRGANRSAFCPFHDNTDTPAFSVNVEEGLYRCMNPVCDAHGDVVTFYMRVRGLAFREAVFELARRVGLNPDADEPRPEPADPAAQMARNDALLAAYRPGEVVDAVPEPVAAVPTIDSAIVGAMHRRLLDAPAELAWLAERRGIARETVERFQIGHDGQRYFIPIPDADGQWVNIRRYKPNARRASDKMISWREGFGAARLFPIGALVPETSMETPLVIFEGEMDLVLAVQHGVHAITTTGGAGTWRGEWTPLFAGRHVVIAYDNDDAGHAGAHRIARELLAVAASVRVLLWPHVEPAGFDFTNFIHDLGHTVEDFRRLVAQTSLYQPPPAADMPRAPVGDLRQVTLAEAGRAEHHDTPVSVAVTISGIASAPSIAPKDVQMYCGSFAGTLPICERCPMRPGQGGSNGVLEVELTFEGNDILDYVNVRDTDVLRKLKSQTGIPAKCPVVTERRRRSLNVLEAQAIPDVGQGEQVFGSESYVTRRVYQMVENRDSFIEANRSYRSTMTTVADPKTQSVVHVMSQSIPSQSDIDVFQLSADVRARLAAFQPDGDNVGDLWTRLDTIHDDLERVVRIYQRRDLLTAVDLTFMSPLGFTFQGERIVRGWVEALVIGDSRTGKTTIVQRLLTYYRAGEFASGENTSFAGLVGGLNDLNRSWFTRWGKIPLNDRRLLAIDEAGNLPQEQIGRMSSIRSSGIAEIVKIHAERTNARTRQIWISNPRGNRPLSTYSQGTLAVKELIGAPEDIARFDLVVTAASGDVELAVINAARGADAAIRYTSELCHQRVMWAWSRKADQVMFQDAATASVLRLATVQGEKYRYATEIPLVEPNEQRVKLARLAAAVAAMFFSASENGEQIIVKEAHVEFAYQFLEMLYTKPALAFTEYAAMQRRRFELKTTDEIVKVLRKSPMVARSLMEQEMMTQSDLMEVFRFDERSELREAVTALRDAGFLRRVGSSYYVKTPAAITWLRQELDGRNAAGGTFHAPELAGAAVPNDQATFEAPTDLPDTPW